MDSWNHPEETRTSHLQCWLREWTDGEAAHRSVASRCSPFTEVTIQRDQRLLLLWVSYSCSGRRSSSDNSSKTVGGRTTYRSSSANSSKTVRGRTTYRSSSANSSSKSEWGRTTLPSTTTSSSWKVHPWNLSMKLGRGGNILKGRKCGKG